MLYSIPMEIMERAAEVLTEAESALRDLLGVAAKQGDYPSILRLAELARAIHDLTGTDHSAGLIPTPPADRAVLATRAAKVAKQAPPPRKGEKRYPSFSRAGEELVMLAWSKREKKEYRHKASHSVLQSLAKAMVEKGSAGRVFTTDELLPIRNLADGTDVPNYKVYVAISLLKQTGTIEQHGRSGYSITKDNDFENAVEKIWNALPKLQ